MFSTAKPFSTRLRDATLWPIDKSYANEIDKLKKWIMQRTEYLTTVINNIPPA
jgi:hypothetical protein